MSTAKVYGIIYIAVYLLFLLILHAKIADGFPLTLDEHQYLVQAELFSRGEISIPGQGVPDKLLSEHSYSNDKILASKYPPGFSLLLTPFQMLEISYILNPILLCITLYLIYTQLLITMPASSAIFSLAAISANPYLWGYALSYFPMTLGMTIATFFVLFHKRLAHHVSWFYLLILFFYGLTRPFDAMLLGGSLLFWCILGGRTIKGFTYFCAPALGTMIVGILVFKITGRYSVYFSGEMPFAPALLLSQDYNLRYLIKWFLDSFSTVTVSVWMDSFLRYSGYLQCSLGVLFILVFSLKDKEGSDENLVSTARLTVITLFLFVLAYAMVPFKGWNIYGSRYYYILFALISYFSIIGMWYISHFFRRPKWDSTRFPSQKLIFGTGITVLSLVNLWCSFEKAEERKFHSSLARRMGESINMNCIEGSVAIIDFQLQEFRPLYVDDGLVRRYSFPDGSVPYDRFMNGKKILAFPRLIWIKLLPDIPQWILEKPQCSLTIQPTISELKEFDTITRRIFFVPLVLDLVPFYKLKS
jgi:hypothetical protein